jgi:hypothetical protein
MRRIIRALVLLGAVWGCSGPSLDVPGRAGASVVVDFEPAVDPAAAPQVFRARVRHAPASAAPWLFRGELSSYYARALQRGEVPSALVDRAVPLRFWHDQTDCWLQPTEWLAADATYTLALTGHGALQVVHVTDAGRVRRLFPPAGSPKYRSAVVCDLPDSNQLEPLRLEPGGISLTATSGMAGLASAGCVTLLAGPEVAEPVVAPPVLAGGPLDPSPWLPVPPRTLTQAPPPCAAGEQFHGGCLEVLDDRLRITPLTTDLLFVITEPQNAVLSARAGSRVALLSGLSPATQLVLSGTVLASSGQVDAFRTTLTTATPRRHLVLNEVLANPVGPEPEGEWIELVNDSDQPGSLSGLWLEDGGGQVALPDDELGPGELALLVGDGFRASGLDVSIPPGVRLLRLPSLGARGLSNSGEGLLLIGREGVLSRFPLVAAAHAGKSIARRGLDAADDDPTAFAEHGAPGASPGATNSFDD